MWGFEDESTTSTNKWGWINKSTNLDKKLEPANTNPKTPFFLGSFPWSCCWAVFFEDFSVMGALSTDLGIFWDWWDSHCWNWQLGRVWWFFSLNLGHFMWSITDSVTSNFSGDHFSGPKLVPKDLLLFQPSSTLKNIAIYIIRSKILEQMIP